MTKISRGRKKLGELLVDSQMITAEQLEEALKGKRSDEKLGDTLIRSGSISEKNLIEVLEFQLGIPYISLYTHPIDSRVLNIVSRDTAIRNLLIPIKKEGDKLFVAMADPMDFNAIDDLRLSTGFRIELFLATRDDILRSINKHYGLVEDVDGFSEDMPGLAEKPEDHFIDENSPIIKLVNQLIIAGVQQNASDIHIDPQEAKIVVRYRVDGLLRPEKTLSRNILPTMIARIKILANLNITEYRVPQDGRIKANIDGHKVDLRISTLPTVYGEKVVMRILDSANVYVDLERMNFHPVNYERFNRMIERPTGIVLITGPTGSGKSSTLYAALSRLNTQEVNIITVEDPVEYQLKGINQVQVNAGVGMTFAKGLRSILRQDPDIVMIGEIRDTETVEIAVRASLTGHLVLSTIHTNDAIGTITRLIDMGVEPFLVAASLSGVVSQRLVRRVCRECGSIQAPTQGEIEIFAKRGLKLEKVVRGKGCGSCSMTGYKGRIAIHEILEVDDELRRIIMNHQSTDQIRECAIRKKTIFLIDDGLMKVREGLTTTEEILRVAISE